MITFWWEKADEQDFIIPRSDMWPAELYCRANEPGRTAFDGESASLEQRPSKVREQATLLFGEEIPGRKCSLGKGPEVGSGQGVLCGCV